MSCQDLDPFVQWKVTIYRNVSRNLFTASKANKAEVNDKRRENDGSIRKNRDPLLRVLTSFCLNWKHVREDYESFFERFSKGWREKERLAKRSSFSFSIYFLSRWDYRWKANRRRLTFHVFYLVIRSNAIIFVSWSESLKRIVTIVYVTFMQRRRMKNEEESWKKMSLNKCTC